jgi:hypothetical protein
MTQVQNLAPPPAPTPPAGLSDDELLARFSDRSLPSFAFGHREHLRVAFALLAKHGDFGEAAVAFRRLLRAYAEAHGAAGRYHETMTWAYLALVHERMSGHEDADSMLRAHPDLLDHRGGALARHYDVDALLADEVARRVLVLPTREKAPR